MSNILKMTVVFLVVGLLAGCTIGVGPASPGQAIASENNFENGVKQYEMGHYKQAVHEFEKAIEKDPTNYKAYYYLGMSYKGDGVLSQALTYLEKALGLTGNDAVWAAKIRNEINALTQTQEQHGHGNQDNQGHGKDK